ncbi:MAG: hypothetical protein WC719_02835 [Patescibacteria group bacterium]|jgi:hypothetical protein
MLKNKKNIIIAGAAALILITALVLALVNRRQTGTNNQNIGGTETTPVSGPEFLTTQEKAYLNLGDNVRAQVLSRNASGAPAVYKVIKTDADIISDISKIEPISPRLVEAAK